MLGNGHAFFSKESNVLCSFAKECHVLCVRLHALQKNVAFFAFFAFFRPLQKNAAFFAFFYVLCKRTLHSLRPFTFLRKEQKRMHRSFGIHKSPKTRKKNAKEPCVHLKNAIEQCVQDVKELVPNPANMWKPPIG